VLGERLGAPAETPTEERAAAADDGQVAREMSDEVMPAELYADSNAPGSG